MPCFIRIRSHSLVLFNLTQMRLLCNDNPKSVMSEASIILERFLAAIIKPESRTKDDDVESVDGKDIGQFSHTISPAVL